MPKVINDMLWRLARGIDFANGLIGRTAAWLTLAMVLVQFGVVVMRYVFGIGSIMLQESIVYMHGLLFMMAAADTLLNDQHVRVDIFYARRSPFGQAVTNLLGHAFMLLPFCVLIVIVSWDYVSISWSVREGSRETSGIQGVFLLKSVILVFAVQMALQAVSLILQNILHITENKQKNGITDNG